MTIEIGPLKYKWIENWAKLPTSEGWAHHGIAVTSEGNIVTGDGAKPVIHVLDKDGNLLRSFDVPVTETHGITISQEDGKDVLWVVDTGDKYQTQSTTEVQILKCDMDGNVQARLTRKDFNYAEGDPFCLTACTVDPNSGKLWVTDGYGANRIHRFSQDLKLELTIDGTQGEAGALSQPHWIFADTRSGKTEIYVADRANDQIQVYSPEGDFLRNLKEGLITPSGFGVFDDIMVVAELKARLVILDKDDNILGTIGQGHKYLDREGWPNKIENEKPASPLDLIESGTFNSPHGMCVDPEGNIYVSEWLIGDRFIKLERQ